jgi:RNA polymerase sigma-70 factor (ECF subfamily)
VARSPTSEIAPPPDIGSDSYGDWDAIYTDNVTWVYRMLYAKVGNRADAEDLTAGVFLAALRPLRTGARRAEVRGYLAATARSELARYWRRRLGAQATITDQVAALRALEDRSGPSDAPRRVERILDRLPHRYRQILELRFLDALTVKEAAHAMGISVANAKVLQHRALRMADTTASRDTEHAFVPRQNRASYA